MSSEYDPIAHMTGIIKDTEDILQYHRSLVILCRQRANYSTKNSTIHNQALTELNMHKRYVESLEATVTIHYSILRQLKNPKV